MTTSNLSIVDSLIRSHFGSNLWIRSNDLNFLNEDRIKKINECFKDLPVKSKLYILLTIGNLDAERYAQWRNEVETIILRAMVEGNLLVRAIATILQHKLGMNYLTFDISLSLDNFAEILQQLSEKLDEWDGLSDIRMEEYIGDNVVKELRRNMDEYRLTAGRKRRFSDAFDRGIISSIGCELKRKAKSQREKSDFLHKLEAECNKKRISVPIPGRNKNKNGAQESERDAMMRSIRQSEQQRKELEIDAKLEEWRRRNQQGKSVAGKKESKLICLNIEDLPPEGARGRQMMREKEREAKRVEKELKQQRIKEEKEQERVRKQQEKENKRLAQQMIREQQQQQQQQQRVIHLEKEMLSPPTNTDNIVPMKIFPPTMTSNINAIASVQPPVPPAVKIISSQTLAGTTYRPVQSQQPSVVVIQSPFASPTPSAIVQPRYVSPPTASNSVKVVRLVSNGNLIPQQQSQLPPQSSPRIVRILGSPTRISLPTAQSLQQPSGSVVHSMQLQQQAVVSTAPQNLQNVETVKFLIRYANRLTRPQKATIISFMTGSADGCDFNGQTSVHISSHRACNYKPYQILNLVVDAYFFMDFRTRRWSIAKRYREPATADELLNLELQPEDYPPDISSSMS